ncbi:MAG: two pore domain potassium channel family protein [Clostridia bacterium]|nr:two pore domain potassium channel family protein [Clostridia bacterium]
MKTETKTKAIRIFASAVLCAALMVALMNLSKSSLMEPNGATYLGLAFLFFGVYELAIFFYLRRTQHKKTDFIQFAYVALCVVAGLCAFIIPETSRAFVVPSLLYLAVPTVKRILAITRKGKLKKVYHIMVLVMCALAILLTVGLVLANVEGNYSMTSIGASAVCILSCLVNICMTVFSQFNKEILLRIVKKTYAGEIIIGLLLLVIAFSLILMNNEDSIHNFGDALWYCFAVITTIGFGDIAAVSGLGRVLTVILGLYGIICVSIFTSIIVNFYNEVKDNGDDEGIEKAKAFGEIEEAKTAAALADEADEEESAKDEDEDVVPEDAALSLPDSPAPCEAAPPTDADADDE